MSNEVLMCEVVPELPAVMRYRWPWDPPEQWKPCSARGQFLLQQKGKRLNKTPSFLPLEVSNPEDRPLEKTERQNLHAAKLAAEDELKEAQARSTRLYNQTVELTADLKSERRKTEQLEVQLKAKAEDLEKSLAERGRLSGQVGQLQTELQKANRIIEAQGGESAEFGSMKQQLDAAAERIASLTGELNAAREKHELKLAEVGRALDAANEENARLTAKVEEVQGELAQRFKDGPSE